MKKVITSLLVFASLLLFTACGKKVTTEDLKANDWLIEATKDDEPNMIVSFLITSYLLVLTQVL